jgi:hypothetical protein
MNFDKKYDLLIDQTGGFGRFQWLNVSGFLCSMLSSGWYLYGLTFYELMPKSGFQCLENGVWVACTPAEFCGSNIEHKIDYS